MSAPDPTFGEFFEAVWGVAPHRWQSRLADQVLTAGEWPDVIDLPTGAGKTAALDVAVFTLALQPDRFARRIAFVIDRRLVVDQTTRRAAALAKQLASATGGPVFAVAERLRSISSSGAPLAVGSLRGGDRRPGSDDIVGSQWLHWPDQPAVVVSTVDQFGSRLLHRGYGVGPRMWPIHAGLTGNDCLVLLDEVHLSTALAETLTDLDTALRPVRSLPRRGKLVQLSATPVGAAGQRFTLDDSERSDGSDLARRISARKVATLCEIGKARQPAVDAWCAAAPRLLAQLDSEGVVGIVVNRVATARALGEALDTPLVLTGRMRPFERRAVESRVIELTDPDRAESAGRSVVVATQCIEVGADLSFDAMLTEASSLSSLRQRFGRLDRRGRLAAAGAAARAIVVGVRSALDIDPDPVYGRAMRATWDALCVAYGSEEFDVGPVSADLQRIDDVPDVHVPATNAAVLMPTHLDLLSHTNPAPTLSPEVAPFLHGFARRDPDVLVLWRADLGPVADNDVVGEVLRLFPPLEAETLAVPLSAVRRWLATGAATAVADADAAPTDDAIVDDAAAAASIVRWTRGDRVAEWISLHEIHPGDVLVVPSERGGLSQGTWAPESTVPVPDIASQVAAGTERLVVRSCDLDPGAAGEHADGVVGGLPDADQAALWRERLIAGATWMTPEQRERLRQGRPKRYGVNGSRWYIMVDPAPTIDEFDGSDEASSFTGRCITLASHLDGVGAFAERFARNVGLDDLAADFRLAGELHDLGKVDSRFQLLLHGDEVAAAMATEPIAKSPHRRRVSSTYPRGMRHEYLSIELIGDLLDEYDVSDPELVLHLIASHHGHARPVPILVIDPSPEDVSYIVDGRELTANTALPSRRHGAAAVERFERLIERYGWHGLAWLEAVFRLADHRRSELEAAGTEGN